MDHDQRFKTLLTTFFPEFLALFVPVWADLLRGPPREWLQQEAFLDPPQGERRILDLIARFDLRQPLALSPGDTAQEEALVLAEVEAGEGVGDLRRRLPKYYRGLRDRHDRPVLPVALYLSVALDGLGWDAYVETVAGQRLQELRWPYIALPGLDGLQYVEGTNWLGVALAARMRIPEDRRAWVKARAMERLFGCPENVARKYLLAECVEAYLPLEGPHLAEYDRLLTTPAFQGAKQMAVSTLDKARAEGKAEGQREYFSRLLAKKFGPLSGAVQERVAQLPPERIWALGEVLLTANSLQDLGLEG